jgi:hypothetical protein
MHEEAMIDTTELILVAPGLPGWHVEGYHW